MPRSRLSWRRGLAAFITIGVLGSVLAILAAPSDRGPPAESLRTARSHDAAMYGGSVSRNMVNLVDRNLPDDWNLQTGKNVKWKARLGSRAYGGPIIAGGRVYVGTNNEAPRDPAIAGDKGVLMCFREADGKFLWQGTHDKHPAGTVHDWPREGLCSAPTVVRDRLYYVSNRGELVCADAVTGPGHNASQAFWRLDMIRELNAFPHNASLCSALVIDDLVFVITGNGVDEEHIKAPHPDAPSFIAVNKKTGKVVWKDNSPGKNVMHGQWSSAAYAEANGRGQVIFPGGDGWLRAFDPKTGRLIWKFDCNPKDAKYALGGRGTKSDFIAAPVVVGNHCYIGTGQDPEHYEGVGHLWCIDITRSGDVSPELVVDASKFPPRSKPNPASAVVWHYGGVAAKGDAEKNDRNYLFGRTMSTVAVHDGLVYAAELAGYLHCLDARTGKKLWDHDLRAAIWGSPYWVDGKVYVNTEEGDVWIFPHGREKKPPKRIEMDQPIRGTPVACNGVLYIQTESHLVAISAK